MVKYKNPKPMVDVIIQKGNCIVLIERGKEPYRKKLAIPGGYVEYGETVENAAKREAKEETSLDIKLESILGVYSDPKRDPRDHAISTVFIAEPLSDNLVAKSDASKTYWVQIDKIELNNLAFDHARILLDYIKWKKYSKRTFWSTCKS
jgi:ADP-ribose pyrophosphatase YjhB (NUDIX family)